MQMYCVYRVRPSGKLVYVSRSMTQSKELAEDIARGLSKGEIVMPDGSTVKVAAYPHIAKPYARFDELAIDTPPYRGRWIDE